MIYEKFATNKSVGNNPWEIFDENSIGNDSWEICDERIRLKWAMGNFRRKISVWNFPRILSDGFSVGKFQEIEKIRRFKFPTTIFSTDFCPLEICQKFPVSDEFLLLPTDFCHKKNAIFFVVLIHIKLITIVSMIKY